MIPIGDDKLRNPITPFVTWLIIIINVLIFFYEIRLDEEGLNNFVWNYGATPIRILHGENLAGIFTSMFLHGGWMHLIGNMLFLWVFGDNIEAALGHLGFLIFYIAGGLAATLTHVFMNAGSEAPSVGASGAISAALGAYIIMFPRNKVRMLIPLGFIFTTVRISAWLFLGIWIVIQLFSSGLLSQVDTMDAKGGVAWWAHIGGFAFGFLVGWLFRNRARDL